jgi:glutathione S-transferase
MFKLKLTYFDIHGGRGEPARLAMFIGGIEFEDRRIPFDAWPTVKAQTPFHAVPVLEVDGSVITQSNTINRFVGKLANLYPNDPWQAALCDEVMDAVEDISHKIGATFAINDQTEKKIVRETLASGPIPLYLTRLQTLLQERGGEYFADKRLTVADLRVFVWIRHLRSGDLDHIPTDLVDRTAPLLVKHLERLNNDAKIVAYYENR